MWRSNCQLQRVVLWLLLTWGVQMAALAVALTVADLGTPGLSGELQTNASGGLVLSGSGSGIGLRRDQGSFAWTEQIGDFDLAVRVESLSTPDLFGRAGLMARTGLEPESTFAGVFATDSVAGILFQARETMGANGRQAGAVLPNYPYAWVRLKRTGDIFTGAASTDGRRWTKLESATLTTTNRVYVGLAITSWSTNQIATAVFHDWMEPTAPIQLATTPSRELPGPSSRRTGLAISEIMYHPAARPDRRNLEFVELFNSQSVVADLSGYRLAGAAEYTFPEGTILRPGGFLIIAHVPEDFRAVYGLTNVLGGYAGQLDNGSGVVRLVTSLGAVLLEARYDSQPPWPAAADGAGHSLVLSRPSYGERNVEAWSASGFIGGSPGRWDSELEDGLSQVVINEVQSRSTSPTLDFVELFNHSNEPVDVSGAYLSDRLALNRYRIPNGTTIPPRGYLTLDETRLGFALSAAGETVYFTAPDGLRVIDAVRFGAQELGATYGRTPDGAPTLRALEQPTPGQANAAGWRADIVINEIMFNPVSANDDEQFIELFNRGVSSVSLAGWRFASGVRFSFPANVILPAGGYLVVAKNAVRLRALHPELTAGTCLGDFEGNLSGKGEHLILSRPERLASTDPNGAATEQIAWVTVAEVNYAAGGHWGRWSDGGGSSLELVDARAEPTLAGNWGDSDETGKGEWTTIEHTGVLDWGHSQYAPTQLHVLMEGVGECLLDDVEVIGPGGTNMVTNGNFENGLAGWTPQGSHRDSTLETGTGLGGSQCLHIRAESRGDPGANRIRVNIAPGLRDGSTATLRAKVRWLRGFPEILLRLRGNYLEATGRLGTTTALGTPGRQNSRFISNAPPAIYDVTHSPVLPAVDQPVTISARVHDPDGLATFLLRYRVDPSPDLTEVTMRDDGTGGDAVAGDGLYSATIPGQPASTLVAFHLSAADLHSSPASGAFPARAPAQECLVRFGEIQPGGSFGTYRIWMTQAVRNRWSSREKLNNAPLDVTFVYGNQRAIYNAGSLYTGSPFVSGGYSGPTGALCGYAVHFPEDDLFLGIREMKLDWPVRDPSLQMEQVAYWIGGQMGIPTNHRRFVFLYVNGVRRGTLYEDAQQPNSDMVAQYFPEDEDGDLYKIDDWFEFDNAASGFVNTDATLQKFTTTGGEHKKARYRWNWRKRAVKESANDYRNLFALADATEAGTSDQFTRQLDALIDVEEFLRVIAFEHIVGNWDSFGHSRGKNMFTYKPERGKWNLLTWDIDFVLGAQSDSPDGYLFGTIDPTVSRMMFHPPFQRVYLRALSDAARGPLQTSRFAPVLAGNYAAFLANGITPPLPNSGSNFMTGRLRHINQELSNVNVPFTLSTSNNISTPSNLFLLEGTAPIQAREILVNGIAYPITWLDVSRWQMRVPLGASANPLQVVALDTQGRPISGAQASLNVSYTGTAQAPQGHIVFNEVMYQPSIPGAEFVELHNNSSSHSFDLSGWQVSGLDELLPVGTVLEPGGFLVLARDRTAFSEAYGPDVVPLDLYEGRLASEGETLRLIQPGTNSADDRVIAELSYSSRPPWPLPASQGGVSLQLRDPLQDQNRVGNWATRLPTAPAEWELVSVTARPTSSRLLLYLSGLPPVRDLSSIEGTWDGSVNFGGGSSPFRVEFRPGPDGEWHGDFIYDSPAGEQRITLGSVAVTNSVLTFGFSSEQPEFRFPITGEAISLTGRYQPPEQASLAATLKRSAPGGDVYVDDLWLAKGTAPETGSNLIRNGDFESPLENSWVLGSNHVASVPAAGIQHSGNASLQLVATAGALRATDAVWQDLPALEPGETYTLSYWVRRGVNATALVVRLEDWSLASTHELRLVRPAPVAFTPGSTNSTWAALPELPLLWLNELQPVNLNGPTDPSGQRSPWVELFNAGTNALSLAGYSLANAYSNATVWPFPANAVINPGEYRLVWLDGNTSQSSDSDWHGSFRPSAGSGILVLSRRLGEEDQIVDYLEYSTLTDGSSVGWAAEGPSSRRVVFIQPTPLQSNAGALNTLVVINEWMAANNQTQPNPVGGAFDDWFELYNPGASTVDLSGYTLSDSVTDPSRFVIPPGTIIPAHGHLLIWADGSPQQNHADGDLHASFRLDTAGEDLLLSAPDGTPIDLVSFGRQLPDVSEGRWPDGAPQPWRALTEPTPGEANVWSHELLLKTVQHTSDGRIIASWSSTAGQQFRLQFKNDLTDATWIELDQTIVASGPETQVALDISSASDQRFFRLILLDPR